MPALGAYMPFMLILQPTASRVFDMSRNEIRIEALTDIEPGTELCTAYHGHQPGQQKTNERMLRGFNFVPWRNPYEEVELFADMPAARAWCAEQAVRRSKS